MSTTRDGIEYLKTLKRGDWVFTCTLEPQQFDSFMPNNPEHFDRSKFTEDAWELFINYGYFTTMRGNHSTINCGCTRVSEKYAKWFNENKVYELYDQDESFDVYECKIRELCIRDGIEFEGY